MLRSSRAPALILLASALVTACGGSGSSGPKPAPISPAEAARFLTQTTFGPVPEAVADLQQRGYAGWIEHQIALPVSRQLPYLQALPQPVSQVDRLDAFFQNAIGRPDQLRQRMAFALSEIFVVSDQAVLFDQPLGLADYYDLLAAQARQPRDLSSLRYGASAGETLPAPTYEAFRAATGVELLDGIGSTEMLHIFITNRLGDAVGGATGKPVSGYEARVVDDDMKEVADGTVGHLAVRGPTGCRYLADARQATYVREGWNLTGDDFVRDKTGVFHFMARADDMIISSGYNIAGPEVEAALLAHPDVAECAVVGAPDAERGHIVEAHVVLRDGVAGDEACVKALQDHVKAKIAPYKYPRSVKFVAALPKTQTGKIQRFRLKAQS